MKKVLFLLWFGSFLVSQVALADYTVTLLPGYAQAINNNGQVVGVYDVNGMTRGYFYDKGAVTDIGSLSPYGWVSPIAINNSGQVAGSAVLSNGYAHSFLYSQGTMTDIGTFSTQNFAYGINNNGQIVGDNETPVWNAYRYDSTSASLTNISSLRVAYGINDNGQIIGEVGGRSYLWNNGVLTDLGTLGGSNVIARAINLSGQITGWSDIGSQTHAFLWDKGVMKDLGTLGGTISYAYGINSYGQVVGWSQMANGESHGFLYTDGKMTDIGDIRPKGINDLGQIVGYDVATGGGIILTPSNVPIPGAVWLLGSGLIGLFAMRRKFRK